MDRNISESDPLVKVANNSSTLMYELYSIDIARLDANSEALTPGQ